MQKNSNAYHRDACGDFHLVDVRHPASGGSIVILSNCQPRETYTMSMTVRKTKYLIPLLLPILLNACGGEPEISFASDVKPILEQNCLSCHQPGGTGFEASGLSMVSYDDLMKGSEGGPMVIPEDEMGSNLVVLMEGRADPSISMPHGKMEPVAQKEIDVIKRWIAQGAKNN